MAIARRCWRLSRKWKTGLSETQRLATEHTQQSAASEQAGQALSISTLLYKDGLDNYLSVSVAQVQALAAQLSEVQIQVREIQAAVSLIRALGGGWSVQQLPNEKQTLQFTESDYGVRR
jgi:outer membrane protein, multidrug efflux system